MEQRLKFSKRQRKSLKDVFDALPEYKNSKSAESFLLCYIAFETITRKVWHFHRSAKSNKEIQDSHSPLNLSAVKSAFKTFNIKVPDSVIDPILDSSLKQRGSMSVRSLRNGLVHQWKVKDRDEVVARFNEIMPYLEKVITAIKVEIK